MGIIQHSLKFVNLMLHNSQLRLAENGVYSRVSDEILSPVMPKRTRSEPQKKAEALPFSGELPPLSFIVHSQFRIVHSPST